MIINGNIVISDECPNCMNHFYYDNIINLTSDHKFFPVQSFAFEPKGQELELAKSICSALNAGSGLIAIGVNKEYRIKGMILNEAEVYQLESAIKNIRKSFVFP